MRNMAHKTSLGPLLAVLLLSSFGAAVAQTPAGRISEQTLSAGLQASRVAGDWRSSQAAAISASRPPLSVAGQKLGASPAGAQLDRMLLLLDSSADRKQALIAELENQQNPASAEYHRWLSPAAFAAAYGNSASDVAAVSAWLQSQGFKVAPLPAGRGWIEFSGTVSQVEQAFHTQVISVAASAGARSVLAGEISVPAALKPLIHGLVSLDGALSAPALTAALPVTVSVASLAAESSPNKAEALTPQLVAQILHLDALQAAGVKGAGETIAIAARSNVNSGDLAAFRSAFGLPASAIAITPNGPDPGQTGDQAEATLAASWAGAAAPGAQILLVPAATTAATDGVDLSLAAIVDQALAHTVTVGFSDCEAALSEAHQAFYAALYRQAAAEGIAIIAAAGDSGPAACHAAGSDARVSSGYGVNALASTPWNTAVGVAALSATGSAMAAWSPVNPADPAYAGGGGGSTLYAAPSWQPLTAQAGASSTASGFRLLPDLALPTALDSGASRGLVFCLGGAVVSSSCTPVHSGGSSAAASVFAGIAALLAEKHGAQGNLAPNLYALSRTNGAFEDVQLGSAQLPCAASSPDCGATGSIGYAADSGYDLATGLGSVNAETLVNNWNPRPDAGSGLVSVAVAISPPQINQIYNPSAQVTFTASVVSQISGPTPTGTVTFYNSVTKQAISSTPTQTLDGNGNALLPLTLNSLFLTSTNYSFDAAYSGDGTYAPLTSLPLAFTLVPSCTNLTITTPSTTPLPGATIPVTVTVGVSTSCGPPAGSLPPTGNIALNIDGGSNSTAQLTTTNGVTSAAFSVVAPSGGTTSAHELNAAYSGDANYAQSSASLPITITPATTSLTIDPLPTGLVAGGSMPVTAVLSTTNAGSVVPTGTVTFSIDNVQAGTSTLVSGTTASTTLTGLVAGSHSLVAKYGGDGNFVGATSLPVSFSVSKNSTTLTVTPPSTAPNAGTSFQVTANIGTTSTGSVVPTGTVAFYLDSNAPVSVNVSGTTATATLTASSAGNHTLYAVYSGDNNFGGSTSSTVSFTAGKSSTTLIVNPSTNSPLGGSLMLVTATLNATYAGSIIPTGQVTFMMDGVTQATVTLVAGSTASTTITVPATGTHTLQASYSGDSNYSYVLSPQVQFTVAKTSTTMVVIPATTTPALGATLLVTANITPSSLGASLPTGIVTFTLDGATVAVAQVTGGSPTTASTTLPAMTPGTHTVTATYSGDNYYASSSGTAPTITVAKSPTSMIVTPATTTPAGGSSLVVTATITATSPGSTVPTGTVAYTLDGATVGTSAVVPGYPSTSTITLPSITPGTHTLQGTYSGDTYYATSTAAAVTITVSKGASATVLTPSTLTPTAGGSMVVTVTVTSPNPGATQPTGTVNITQDGTSVGTGTLVPGAPSTATVTIPLVTAGSHILQATYTGDTYYTGSTSATVDIVAAKGATATTLAATPPALAAGITETLTATVTPLNPVTGTVYTITGSVSFYDGGTTLLGTANLSNNTATLTGVKLANNVSHTITAIYTGDGNWVGSASAALPLAATTLPDYVLLTSNVATSQPGEAIVLIATVTPAALPAAGAEQYPTGNVVFYDGTTVLGEIPLVASTAPLSDAATATLTTQTLPGGQDTIYAVYLGDLYYDQASSNLLTLDVEDFTITPAAGNPATNLTIVKGAAGAASFVITGLGGFNNEVQVVCAVPTQDYMTCTATPQQVVPSATVTFVVQTFDSGNSTIAANRKHQPVWPRAAGGTALALLAFFVLPFGRRARIFAGRQSRRFWILVLLLIGMGTAGMGCSNVTLVNATGTPLGVAIIKITGTAYVDNTVVSRNVYLTVNVVTAP